MQEIDTSVFRAEGSQIFGKVKIAEGSSHWFNAVIRAEAQEVVVGRYTNLQDFSMIHVGYDAPVHIGDFCSIAHRATIHGATLGDDCLVGIGATLMDGATIGPGSIVAGGALVTEGSVFPANSILVGTPARLVKERDNRRANRMNAWHYHRNAQAYMRGHHRAWDGEEYLGWLEARKAEIDADLAGGE
jgi:carbonic anhydrase/acetyltransferase-like protein (isoleucine patch superfamily)